MKKELEAAAELFRRNETLSDIEASDHERANLYRGLALLAEGLRKIERRFERLDAEVSGGFLRGDAGMARRRLRPRLMVAPHA